MCIISDWSIFEQPNYTGYSSLVLIYNLISFINIIPIPIIGTYAYDRLVCHSDSKDKLYMI